MKRLVATSLLALVALAGVFVVMDNRQKVSLQEQHIAELYSARETELPEVGQAFYLTLFTHSDNPQSDPKDRQIKSWLATVPELASLKAQCNYNEYKPSDKLTAGYAKSGRFDPAHTPALRLQDSEGHDVYYTDSRAIGDKPWPIVWGIKKKLSEMFPHMVRPPKQNPYCPNNDCKPKPVDTTVNVAVKPPVPTIDVADEPKDVALPAAAIIAVIVFVCVLWGTKDSNSI